jgi:NAD(P)-dependent dehydrogenase (short-subunit alcohol dehydrogenase family)
MLGRFSTHDSRIFYIENGKLKMENGIWPSLQGKIALITGGGGVLCRAMCLALAGAGARVVVLDLKLESAQKVVDEITAQGGEGYAIACNVLEKPALEEAARAVKERYDRLDILINGAGGNNPKATTSPAQSFFDLSPEAIQWVFNLNFLGTLLPCQVFGPLMVQQQAGVILNIASMNAIRPLTRIPAYSGAKAAVANFTQWLAVHMAQEYSPQIRVNAIAPGFFMGQQNRSLLVDPNGELTGRGKTIIGHTPMGRFGTPEDLLGTVLWLVSSASAFVTGIVVPVDGGFSAFSGV